MLKQNFRCPICAKHIFKIENDLEICPVCGYENRAAQNTSYEADAKAEFPVRSFRAEYFGRRKEDNE